MLPERRMKKSEGVGTAILAAIFLALCALALAAEPGDEVWAASHRAAGDAGGKASNEANAMARDPTFPAGAFEGEEDAALESGVKRKRKSQGWLLSADYAEQGACTAFPLL